MPCSTLCPPMLASHVMEGSFSFWPFVGRKLQDHVDAFCPCGTDAALVALGGRRRASLPDGFSSIRCVCLVRQRIHALPYLAAYCSVSALPEKYRHFWIFWGDFGPLVFGCIRRVCLVRQWIHVHARSARARFRPSELREISMLWVMAFTKRFSYSARCLVRRIHAHASSLRRLSQISHIFHAKVDSGRFYLGHCFTGASFRALTCRHLFRLRQGWSCQRSPSLFTQLATSSSLWTT